MPLITDPDLLNDTATDNGLGEVFINVATRRIKLNTTGNLSTDGVTLKALYSFLKEEWGSDTHNKNLPAIPFPMVAITDESFEFVEGWDLFNDTARYLIRTAGWTVRSALGSVTAMWTGIIGLGFIESNDQLYYQQTSTGAAVNVVLPGQINQAVQVLSDPNGDGNYTDGFDRRSFFKILTREQGQRYGSSSLSDIGVTTMAAQAYRFPLSTGADLKIIRSDVAIDANSDGVADVAPYSGMSITYLAAPQAINIGGTNRNFGIIINANNGTAEQVYEFVQWSLRQNSDIDADASTRNGKTADELLTFVGDTLKTRTAANPDGGGTGVYIQNFQIKDINRLVFVDNLGTERTFPFVATLTINFGANLVADPQAQYWVYFSTLPGAGNDFGEAGALLVEDNASLPMEGTISGNGTISLTFNYDGNSQGGRTPGQDAQVTAVAIGRATGQYVRATANIARSTSNSISLVAALERNYANL